jgi:hypothetical protein
MSALVCGDLMRQKRKYWLGRNRDEGTVLDAAPVQRRWRPAITNLKVLAAALKLYAP